jgi:DNA-binding NarL/FixJ family response regulator
MFGPSIVTETGLRGRDDMQAAISVILANAKDGRGSALSLYGDVGVGKTALLDAAADQVRSFLVLATSGSEREADLPFAGLHRLLSPVVDRVASLPAPQATILTRVLESGACGPDEMFALDAAVLGLLRLIAADRTLLCCIDDVQWLDRPSLDSLAFAARRLHAERIAMLFAARTGDRAVDLLPGVTSAGVFDLDHATSRDLLADLVPGGLAGDVAGVLATLSGGNPLALVELARSLTPEQKRGETAPPRSLPPDSVLMRVLRGRVAQLPADTQWLVLLAAADADLDVGALMRASRASGIDIAALEPAERANLVQIRGNSLVFPQPLLRTILYDDATLAQRRAVHLLLTQILDPETQPLRYSLHLAAVAEGPDPGLADALARAASTQGSPRAAASRALERAAELTTDPVVAATHLVAAARQAWEGGEPHRARMLLRRVQPTAVPQHVNAQSELLLGEIELRAGTISHARQTLLAAAGDLGQDRQLALSAMMRASEALCLTGEYPRLADVARQALALRRSEEPLGTQLLFEQFAGLTAMFQGNHKVGVAALRRVLALADELHDAVALIRASMAAVVLGDDAQAYRLAHRAVSVARSTGDASSVPQALELAAAAELALGRYAAVRATLLEALPLARATGQESLASNILSTLAVVAGVAGDRDECLKRVHEARAHTAAHGVTRAQALIDWALGALDLAAGKPADALARLKALVSSKSGRGQLVIQIAATPYLVEAAVRCGEREVADRAVSLFAPWATNTENTAWLALLARCRGLLAATDDEADKHFGDALRLHLAGESEFDQARTELLYGQELRRARRPSAAREHLRHALEAFQRLEVPLWVEQAATELRAAGDHVEHRQVSVAEALTPQQLQIARLAAAGATNREVAKHLFLSTRTVDHHMRNIFARLGIRSRVDLAKLMN